jgi:hypothetical protein
MPRRRRSEGAKGRSKKAPSPETSPALKRNPKAPSWVERFAGCAEGPPDLSTNPDHLRDYGK